MAIADEVTTRMGSDILVEITNFDDEDATTVNTTRLAAAVADAETLLRREAGLIEPTDTTTDEYATYVSLACKATRYYLLWYKEPEGQPTKNALQEFKDQAGPWRKRTSVPILTDSPVDTAGQDDEDRPARFPPKHFEGFRIGG